MSHLAERLFTLKELQKHNSRESLWVSLHGKVYDVSRYLDNHPGGIEVLLEVGGKDATEAFDYVGHSSLAQEGLMRYEIGGLAEYRAPKTFQKLVIRTSTQGRSIATDNQMLVSKMASLVLCHKILMVCMLVGASFLWLSGDGWWMQIRKVMPLALALLSFVVGSSASAILIQHKDIRAYKPYYKYSPRYNQLHLQSAS